MPPHEVQHSTKPSAAQIFSVVLLVSIIVAVDSNALAFLSLCVARNDARSWSRYESARRLFATAHSSNARKQRAAAPGCQESFDETKACRSGGLRQSLSKCFPGSHRRSIFHPSKVVQYRRRR